MLIVIIAWLYVVLLMSLTEHSVAAGITTFLLYGLLPLSVVLYLLNTPARRARKRRQTAEGRQHGDDRDDGPPAEDSPPTVQMQKQTHQQAEAQAKNDPVRDRLSS